MSGQPELGCAVCAQKDDVIRTLSGELDEQAIEISGLQQQLRRAGKAEHMLRVQLDQAHEKDTDEDMVIRTLCDAWKRLLGHPRAKTPKTGKRWKVAKAALRHHSAQECLEAIHGLALLPYVGPKGRAATGEEKQRYDELEHCLRDEATVDRFIGYWRRASTAAVDETDAIFDGYFKVAALHSHWVGLVLGARCRREWHEMPAEKRAELVALWRESTEAPRAEPSFVGLPVPEKGGKVIPFPKEAAA